MRSIFLLALVLFCAGPALAAKRPHAEARLAGQDGKALGVVNFSAVNRGVLIEFDLHDLPPGAHGVHLHTSGNCDARARFTSAGPILTLIPG